MISNFLFDFINFCIIISFFDQISNIRYLFSTVVKAVLVAKLVILGISPLSSFILALKLVLVAKLVISGISSSIFLILAFYTSFLTTSFFTTSLNSFKATGTGTNLSTSNLSSLFFKVLKPLSIFLIHQYQIYLH